MKLTEITCKNAKHTNQKSKTPLKLSDGQGLALWVMPNGSKYWRLAYRHNGKQKTLALGVYPDVSLKQARFKRTEAKELIAEGKDPSLEKKKEKAIAVQDSINTFKTVALEWYENRKPSSKDDWEDQFLNEDKLSSIVPATQNVILEQRKELLEHITNPEKDAQKGIEEAASFVYDAAHSQHGLNKELSWIPDLPPEALMELSSGTEEAEQKITLPHGVIKKNVGISPIRQQALYV